MNISRRMLLANSVLVPLAVTGCAGGPSGLDLSKIATDGPAIVQAIESMLAAPTIRALLTASEKDVLSQGEAAVAAAETAVQQLAAMVAQTVTAAAGGQVQTLVTSLLSNAGTVIAIVRPLLPALMGADAMVIGNLVSAAQALLPLVSLAAGLLASPAMAAAGQGMTEEQALQVIRQAVQLRQITSVTIMKLPQGHGLNATLVEFERRWHQMKPEGMPVIGSSHS